MHYASSVCYKLSVCDSKKQSLIVSRRAFRRLHQPSKLILSTEKFLFTRLGCNFTSIPSTSLEGKHRQSPPILNFNICRFNYRGYCDDEILCFDSFTLCWVSLRHLSQHPPKQKERAASAGVAFFSACHRADVGFSSSSMHTR